MLVSCNKQHSEATYRIIPLPQEVITADNEDGFYVNSSTRILFQDSSVEKTALQLASEINQMTSLHIPVEKKDKDNTQNVLSFELGLEHSNQEAYQIAITSKGIQVKAVTPSGAFYAMQTLRKSIPIKKVSSIWFPAAEIKDFPRFSYRGLMLDVSRHFSDVDMVKRTLDMMALHNLNVFHWHLTDDQGWRIEIKKHPRLTEIGAWRDATVAGRYLGGTNYPTDGKRHGGFYTQEQIKEVIAYAKERYITIIPEIDLPGHTSAVLASYPELGCEKKEYKVADRWGVIKEVVCAGNDKSLQLFLDIMDEVSGLFPGKYIHVGGDECVKEKWSACSKCQAKIKQLGLKDDRKFSKEDYLQSYFMGEVAKHIQEKGKQVIGWDEILEGLPLEGSVIMSWRGISGGIEAARMGHDVIMTPTTHLYFDYSQTLDSSKEEVPVGGYINVDRVYSYEPLPEELSDKEKRHIIGVQANVWCEYMPEERIRQYQILPRLAALSEVQWTAPEKKDYPSFLARLPQMIDLYEFKNYSYARHIFDVSIADNPNINEGCLEVDLSTLGNDSIFYSLDGSVPTTSSALYSGTIKISTNTDLKVAAYRENQMSDVSNLNVMCNKATFKPVTLCSELSRMHIYGGAPMLVDGISGSIRPDDARWLGFLEKMEVVIDLKEPTTISQLIFTNLSAMSENISDPNVISISTSTDNRTFCKVKETDIVVKKDKEASISRHTLGFEPIKARFVKVSAKTPGLKTSPYVSWLFVSEISLE